MRAFRELCSIEWHAARSPHEELELLGGCIPNVLHMAGHSGAQSVCPSLSAAEVLWWCSAPLTRIKEAHCKAQVHEGCVPNACCKCTGYPCLWHTAGWLPHSCEARAKFCFQQPGSRHLGVAWRRCKAKVPSRSSWDAPTRLSKYCKDFLFCLSIVPFRAAELRQ